MNEFKFTLNEHGNACYVFVDVDGSPIDTLHLMENDDGIFWVPQSLSVRGLIYGTFTELPEIQDMYNGKYEEVCDAVCTDELLKAPERVCGFYVNDVMHEITESKDIASYGVTHSHEQAEAMIAFCELSHILANFNEGWVPDWHSDDPKWCICGQSDDSIGIREFYRVVRFLAFETEKKAKSFLRYKRGQINKLNRTGLI